MHKFITWEFLCGLAIDTNKFRKGSTVSASPDWSLGGGANLAQAYSVY